MAAEKLIILYKAYKYNTNFWLLEFMVIILVILGMIFQNNNTLTYSGLNTVLSGAVLVFAIMAHIYNRKLKIRSWASIFIYVVNVLGVIEVLMDYLLVRKGGLTMTSAVIILLIALVIVLLQLLAVIFAFRLARKLKHGNPTLIKDYLQLKK